MIIITINNDNNDKDNNNDNNSNKNNNDAYEKENNTKKITKTYINNNFSIDNII